MRAESWEKNVARKPFSLPALQAEQMRQRYDASIRFPLMPREALKYGEWKTFKLQKKPQSGPVGSEIFSHPSLVMLFLRTQLSGSAFPHCPREDVASQWAPAPALTPALERLSNNRCVSPAPVTRWRFFFFPFPPFFLFSSPWSEM